MASDHRLKLLTQLAEYSSDYPVELTFRDRFVDLINSYDNCFERSLLSGHITGSAWIVDQDMTHAFLTHHAKLNRWLQPGGHADGDENVARVALKEALEETGMEGLSLYAEQFFDLDIHPIPERKGVPEHEHFDIRYMIIADRAQRFEVSEESHDLAWIPMEKVAEYTGSNDSILRMVEKTMELRRKMSSRTY